MRNPRRFVFTEERESQAHLDRRLAAPPLQALSEQLPQCIESTDVLLLDKLARGPA